MSFSKNSPGFTLIELMVAVLIAAILLTAAYQVLVGQSRVYETQEQTIDMQQNVRAALDFMGRELRLTGYGVEFTFNVFSNLINNDATDPNIDNGTDSITFVANTNYGSVISDQTISPGDTTIEVNPAPNQNMEFQGGVDGDVVNILSVIPGTGKVRLNFPDVTITNVVYGDPTVFPRTPTTITLDTTINTTNFDPAYMLPQAGDYVTIQPRTISYRVNNNILQRDDGVSGWQDLILDVEDLQFVYAFDEDGDGDIDTDASGIIWAVDTDNDGFLDNQVNVDGSTSALGTNVDISGSSTNCPIRAVRVSILVRTARENPDPRFRSQYSCPRVEDHPAPGTNDGFRRRLLRSVVKLRNLGLLRGI